MKRRLLALSPLLFAASASAIGIAGTVQGGGQGMAPADLRVSAWAVTAFGQPVSELASAALNAGAFRLDVPDAAPPARALVPVDDRLSWPGLIDFEKASAPAQAAELKLFTYRDTNGDGKRQEGEPLREVRAQAGKGEVFVVWASAPVTVTASRSYAVTLKQGWNVMTVEVRGAVVVRPLDSKTSISLNLQ